MILEFSITNFGPIKEKQTLSFEASKDKNLSELYTVEVAPGVRVLKMAAIYGPNASGKTTFLRGIDELRRLVKQYASDPGQRKFINQFRFDKQLKDEPTQFELKFYHSTVLFNYIVSVHDSVVLIEELSYYPKGRIASIFKRKQNQESGLSEIEFGSTIQIPPLSKEIIEANTTAANSVINTCGRLNLELPVLSDFAAWFGSYPLTIIGPNTNLTQWACKNTIDFEERQKIMLQLMKNADLQIDSFTILDDSAADEERHEFPDTDEVNGKIRINQYTILFHHQVVSDGTLFQTPFWDLQESSGTMRLFGLSAILARLIERAGFIPIDELESSLHPDLFKHFLLTFLTNSKQSQLLFTTHNIELLDDRDLLRFDTVWFTQKKNDGSIELFSLGDFDTKVLRKKGSSVLNAYKTGKLGAKPVLGHPWLFTSENGAKK